MASPKKTIYKHKKTDWTAEELEELYIRKNFSMNLVAEVSGIGLPALSRLFQERKLPQKKLNYYDGYIPREKKKLKDAEFDEFFQAVPIPGGRKKSQADLEEEFLKEIGC
ncbi:MAG: hypothetical protein LUE14_04295 [Clostridiales bacterium]|nr:hypothetical protein [Clostridiales bacterium]